MIAYLAFPKLPPVIAYVVTLSPFARLNEPVSSSLPYNEPDVMEYVKVLSAAPYAFDCPAVGVIVIGRNCTSGVDVAVELAYTVEDGVNIADNEVEPIAVGIQSHTAVVDAAVTAPHPEIETPSIMKSTVPAREVVAVMRSTVP